MQCKIRVHQGSVKKGKVDIDGHKSAQMSIVAKNIVTQG